ncbi:hypothetical protein [Spiroplasma endosymbiont of Polydrusus pterygomalis]|uniref:hypothetical protein n=1 Tax=Spiroplasma endosymbiont of Polydrusus pterygomalis TaxID=3139327 RepID=UPI003CCB07CA
MSVASYRNINAHNRWGIIFSSGVMAVTLIISWVLWLIFYRANITEILLILNRVITEQGINFNLTFQFFTVFILIFAVLILIVITLPFLFLTKYGVITLLLSLMIMLVSIIFLGSSGLLIGYGYQNFYNFVMSKRISDILFFALPWALAIICCLFLVFFCLSLIIANLTKRENKNKLVTADNEELLSIEAVSINNNRQNSPFIEQTTAPTVFTERLPNESQGISIIINNTAGNPLSQSKLIDPQVINNLTPIPTTTTNSTVNDEATWTSQQIEAVWNKGEIIENYNPQLYRKDYAGALMFKNSFINNINFNDDPKGLKWTIIYQCPLSHGGTSDISNLQPMNNINAITKANNYPRWKTAITFNGKENILKQKKWKHKK